MLRKMKPSEEYKTSPATAIKQKRLRAILKMHFSICKNVKTARGLPYIYFDLFAGPGIEPGTTNPGSPLVFLSAATAHKLNYRAIFYELNTEYAQLLKRYMRVDLHDNITVYNDDHKALIDQLPYGEYTKYNSPLGLVYVDPSDAKFPFGVLRQITKAYPRLDILINLACASYKRSVERADYVHLHKKLYALKPKWLISKPYERKQWTMLLGSNFPFSDYKKHSLYSTTSPVGKDLLNKLSLTKKEYQQSVQLSLFGEDNEENDD